MSDNLMDLVDPPPSTELLPAEPRQTAVDPDGWVYDVATGEVLGREDLHEVFEVNSAEAAEWVLELRSELEGEIAGIDARLRAVQEMLQALRSEKIRRLSWWEWRFAPSLVTFARTCLKGRAKTAKFGWGQVAFRSTAGSNDILDMERAVEWMRTWHPSKIKVKESVAVKDVLATIDLVASATGEAPEAPSWFISSGPRESVTITTGIDVKIEKGDTP